MTQKQQTDYDKALKEAVNQINDNRHRWNMGEAIEFAFRKGYEYGRKQSAADHERNLIALGDDYQIAYKSAIDKGYCKWRDETDVEDLYEPYDDAYRQGWNDSDAFDEEWTKQHPKDLLDRLLADHPEIIENEVKARMKDLENENPKISRNIATQDILSDKSLMRYEIAKDIFTRCLSHEDGDVRAFCSGNLELTAADCVRQADALIKELGKEEE